MMSWIIAVFAVLLAAESIVWNREMIKLKKLYEANKKTTADILEEHSKAISTMANVLDEMQKSIDEMQRNPEDITDGIERRIAEAREKVFTDWIENITNYDPYNTRK